MPSTTATALERAAQRVREAAIDGVQRVLPDAEEGLLWLVCDAGTDVSEATAAAAALAGAVEVRPLVRPGGGAQPRVRLVAATCAAVDERTRRAEVMLAWEGEHVTGQTTGEPGTAMELRLVAEAALEALHALRPETADVRLVGVKPTRAFDADLMVASLYRPGPPDQRLVGAVLAGEDPHRAAAAAVLGALNRLLGNYLSTR